MKEYLNLTSEIQVPREWPLESAKGLITPLVRSAIIIHNQSDWKVVLTIGDVSAMITKNGTGHGYRFEKIKEM